MADKLKLICKKNGAEAPTFTDGGVYQVLRQEGLGVVIKNNNGHERFVLVGKKSAHLLKTTKTGKPWPFGERAEAVGVFEVYEP